jgi:type I restriction enzyme S subunit
LPLPPNDEIELIMIFIQNQMDLIDKMRKKIEIAIEKLQTYRQSLISEAVTGKIDVRDWERTKKLKL